MLGNGAAAEKSVGQKGELFDLKKYTVTFFFAYSSYILNLEYYENILLISNESYDQ